METIEVINKERFLELTRALNSIPALVEAKVLRWAMRAGMRKIQAALISSYPVKSGKLKDSVKVRAKRKGGNIIVEVVAGQRLRRQPKAGEPTPDLAWYTHILEFGAKPHTISPRKGKDGALRLGNLFLRGEVSHPGVAGRGYMRRAFDGQNMVAIKAFEKEFEKRLAIELAKLPAARPM